MQFQLFSTSAWNAATADKGFLIAMIALACIVCVEVICIILLARKLARARRREKASEEDVQYRDYAVLFALLSVQQIGKTAIPVLAIAAAVFALVLAVLLIVIRAKGYDLAPKKYADDEKEEPVADTYDAFQPEAEASANDDTLTAYPGDYEPYDGEEQEQDALTEPETDEDTRFDDIFADEPVEGEQYEEEAEETAEEDVADEPEEETAVAPAEPVAPAGAPAPAANGATVIETAAPAQSEDTASRATLDEVLSKFSELIDSKLAQPKDGESVATFAAGKPEDEEDDEDEDEEDENDAEDADELDEEPDNEDEHFTGNERIIGFDEKTGCYIVAHYRKSFEAKLIQSKPNIKEYYSNLKNALLAYKGTKSRVSWTADSFHNGRTQIAKINVKTRILELYLALDPATLDGTVYRGKDVGSKKKYAETPFQYKIRTPRKFKWAMELVQRTCEEHGLSPIDIDNVDYVEQYPFDETEHLVEIGLIKEYIRQEKPENTFELDPDHVPEVPTEDESVIPANANFTWEIDNDRMNEPAREEEPVPEPEPEAGAEPEAQPEPAPAAPVTTSVVKETVTVTETHYTKQYYPDGRVVTVTEENFPAPIETTAEEVPEANEAEEPATEPVFAESEPQTAEEEEAVDAVEETEEVEENEAGDEEEIVVIENSDRYKTAEEPEEPVERFFAESDSDRFNADKFEGADPFADYRDEEEEPAEEESEEYADEETEEETSEEYADEETEEETSEEYADEETEEETSEEYADEKTEEETSEEYADEKTEEETSEEYADEETEEETSEEYADEETEEETSEEYTDEQYDENGYDEGEPEEDYEEEPEEPAVVRKRIIDPSVAVIDVCTLEINFSEGATINLDVLKTKGLVLPGATTLNVYASGSITKAFVIEANKFTLDAMQAIDDAGGSMICVH